MKPTLGQNIRQARTTYGLNQTCLLPVSVLVKPRCFSLNR